MSRNYELGLYNEFEKLNKKIDKLLEENKNQSLIIYSLRLEIKSLNRKLDEKDKLIEKLQNENDKLRNGNNKNSGNSSKPPSSDTFKPNKKTGANLYNSREKTSKSKGGQKGHIGSNLSKKKIEKLINDKKMKVIDKVHYINTKSKKDIIKYKVGLEIIPFVERHIFKYDKSSKEVLPKEFYTDVTYDNSIKSLTMNLGAYNVISYDRLKEFYEVITKGMITISSGTLFNFLKEFSNKSIRTLNNLENHIITSNDLNTDETTTKLDGKNMYIRNYSVEDTVLYKAHKNKGHDPIRKDNILTRFTGGIMGDHDTTLYKYGTRNYECNVHLRRYLEELVQNVHNIDWPFRMQDLLSKAYQTREIIKRYKINNFSKEQIEYYECLYDEMLGMAQHQNKDIKSSFYKEKAEKLYKRLKKYKKNHLYFIKDFDVLYDNNMSERDLRFYKRKTKISGGFRNIEASEYYANALSIIKTSIKRNINPMESINAIFNNEVLFG